MLNLDARKMLGAPAAVAAATGAADARARTKRQLSPEALAAASVATRSAISPIVVAGFVRAIEATVIAFIGTVVYYAYVFPTEGLRWPYIVAISGISVISIVAFQAVDIYQVHAFRRPAGLREHRRELGEGVARPRDHQTGRQPLDRRALGIAGHGGYRRGRSFERRQRIRLHGEGEVRGTVRVGRVADPVDRDRAVADDGRADTLGQDGERHRRRQRARVQEGLVGHHRITT